MMKVVIGFLFLMFFASFANGDNTTPYAYNRTKVFCEEGANRDFTTLNNSTQSEVTKINQLKEKINSLIAEKTIITDLTKIKNDYLKNINEIVGLSDNEVANKIKTKTLATYQKLLRNTLTLNAISIMVENNKNNPSSSVNELCAGANEKFKFCGLFSKILRNDVAFNLTLVNFKTALGKTNNNDDDDEIKKIYDSIPKDLNPEHILDILGKDLAVNNNKNLLACLNADANSCESVLKSNSSDIVLNDIHKELKNKLQALHSGNNQVDSYDNILARFNNPIPSSDQETIKSFNENAEKLKEFAEAKKNDFSALNSLPKCTTKIEAKPPLDHAYLMAKLKECQNEITTLEQAINPKIAEIDKKRTELEAQLKTLSEDKKLAKAEYLKHYILQKYERICPTTSAQKLALLQSNIACVYNSKNTFIPNHSEIDKLGQSFAEIINGLVNPEQLKKTGDKSPPKYFTLDEMKIYYNHCLSKNEPEDPTTKKICEEIFKEHNQLLTKKQDREYLNKWHKDNYIKYSSDGRKPEFIRKKNSLVYVAEASAPFLYSLAPMFAQNLQLESQIASLTNMAMMQKQQSYMYGQNSPWAPYFQANYYSTGGAVGFNFMK